MRPSASGRDYVKLESRLVLLAWLNDLFGYKTNQDLLADMAQAGEGFDDHSFIYHRLAGRGERLKISLESLARYDDNVRRHLAAINEHRAEPITLRYFQYLALLYAELFLDWRVNHLDRLVKVLNEFVRERNARMSAGIPAGEVFRERDLSKLAFWMATGSGKTLIMHINYRQFLHYNRGQLDNILLITPNEDLTDQHMAAMALSGIACQRFAAAESGLGLKNHGTVRVIEITKLVGEKRSGGVSVPVEAFEGNNLIFVDEGHKGTGGEAWRSYRDALGETGFSFEYSATFGQALTASKNDALTSEYGKAIGFDYSYKYFHADGYGKDFRVLNLREEASEEDTALLLVGNLLSYYEQLRCFADETDRLRRYNIDRPLWVFVGSSVNAVFTENRQRRSDVLTVTRFLHRFLENKRSWAVRAIQRIIDAKSGLLDGNGDDLFAGQLVYLGRGRETAARIYSSIVSSVFRADGGGSLHVCDIRSSLGELGLKVGGATEYFGLIYIGDTSAFKKLLADDGSGIQVEEDVIASSLFDGINDPATSINLLIGAKKFMEGWSSWRVSNMGLLNIGLTEGPAIIQLFGRGVRLKGLGLSLRRSSAIEGSHPQHIRLLETLNIFAIRANYMAQFRHYLEREGVEVEGSVEIGLAVKPNRSFLSQGLLVPRGRSSGTFASERPLLLAPSRAAQVTVDVSTRIESLRSLSGEVDRVAIQTGSEQIIPSESLDLVDWQRVYVNLLEVKQEKHFANLIVTPEMPRQIVAHETPRLYRLVAAEGLVTPRTFAERELLEEAVCSILRKYCAKYYYVHQSRWDAANMGYSELRDDDPNFQDYVVTISRSEGRLLSAVRALVAEGKRVYKTEVAELPSVHFDRHLYQPLLVERSDKVKTRPVGLKPSEERFVKDLREYCRRKAAVKGEELFLLRNLSRGKGIGFFEREGFYPDFILWVKRRGKQRIVFVEPHGMLMEKAYWNSDKAQLHERLVQLSETWGKKAELKGVVLDSFIISATPYETLRDYYGDGSWTQEDFAERHILFFGNDNGYMQSLL